MAMEDISRLTTSLVVEKLSGDADKCKKSPVQSGDSVFRVRARSTAASFWKKRKGFIRQPKCRQGTEPKQWGAGLHNPKERRRKTSKFVDLPACGARPPEVKHAELLALLAFAFKFRMAGKMPP